MENEDRSLRSRPIGDLATGITESARARVTAAPKSNGSPKDSGTTGTAMESSKKIGTGLSTTGFEMISRIEGCWRKGEVPGTEKALRAFKKSAPDNQQWLKVLEDVSRPANSGLIFQELAKLEALTARRPGDESGMVAAYAEKLAEYPPDAIVYVLAVMADEHKWFPSWVDIRMELDFWLEERRRWLRGARADMHRSMEDGT